MKQKVQFTLFSLIFTILLILISCNEPNIVENTVVEQKKMELNETQKESTLNKQTSFNDKIGKRVKRKDIKGKIITDGSKAPACDQLIVEDWRLDRYEQKTGKTVGIWPRDSEYSISNLNYLRTHWGYSNIFISYTWQYNNAINSSAGYTADNIMRKCSFDQGTTDYEDIIDDEPAANYYIDEAVNHGWWNPNPFADPWQPGSFHRFYHIIELTDVASYINTNRPSSKFVSSGYKRCGHLDILVGGLLDVVMYSAYSHWGNTYYAWPIAVGDNGVEWPPFSETVWVPNGSNDQRDAWTNMKNSYSNKFSTTWISTNSDLGEYTNLFGHAKNLGLNTVWVYANYVNASPQYGNISAAAWSANYLRRFNRKYIDYYRCIEQDPCNNCENPEAIWILYNSVDTGIVEEVYP